MATTSYLSQARVLASSFLEHHPDGHMSVMVVDLDQHPGLASGLDDGSDRVEVVSPGDLAIDQDEFARFAMTHSAFEVAVSLKAALLAHLLDQGSPHAVFLDADLCIYAPLDELGSLAEEHGWVLTPHVLSPTPDDGLEPTDDLFLNAGVFNAGVVAVGSGNRSARAALDWWARQCRLPASGFHHRLTDQWWTAMLPSITPVHVLVDRGVNVAYWNLHERPLHADRDRTWTVAGVPLRCYHFSGYDPDQPAVLSSFLSERPRVTFEGNPELRRLHDDYGARRKAASRSTDPTGFGWHDIDLGLPLDLATRHAVWEALRHGGGPDLASAAKGGSDVVDWLVASPGPGRLPRHLELLVDREPALSDRLVASGTNARTELPQILGGLADDVPVAHLDRLAAATAELFDPDPDAFGRALVVVPDHPDEHRTASAARVTRSLREAGWDVWTTTFRGDAWWSETVDMPATEMARPVHLGLVVSCLSEEHSAAVAHRVVSRSSDVIHESGFDPAISPRYRPELEEESAVEPEQSESPSPAVPDLARRILRRGRSLAGIGARRVRSRVAALRSRTSTYGGRYYGEGRDPLERMGLSGYERYDRDTSNADVAAYVVWRHLPITSSLDVGCATGFVVEALHELGVDSRGVDVSQWAVDNAALGARGRLQVADATRRLPFPDGAVELVTALETLEHLPPESIPKALSELARVSSAWVVATIPSFGPNRNGPDGWFQVKVRDDRVEHYESLGADYTGPVPYDDLYRDADGEPIEGHLTIASYQWWEERFRDVGLVRVDDVERRMHHDIHRFGMTKYWNLYVLRHEGVEVPEAPRDEAACSEVEQRWGLDQRSPQPGDAALLAGVLDDLVEPDA